MSEYFVKAEPSLRSLASRTPQLGAPRRLTTRKQRLMAKAGLLASLSMVTLTGFHKGSRSQGIHLAAGLVLIALSIGHALLYVRPVRRVANKPRPQTQDLEASVSDRLSVAA